MSDFQKALRSFRQVVSQRTKRPESAFHVSPNADWQVGLPDLALPPFIAFHAFIDSGEKAVRRVGGLVHPQEQELPGLAAPNGIVVIVWQNQIENLGLLLEAAHLLEPERALPAVEVASRITWLFGPDYFLLAADRGEWRRPSPPDPVEPTLSRANDGSAELRFIVNQAGDTGYIQPHRIVIRVAPGYRATASMEKYNP